MRSNKPEARKFRKWVTSEVLPSIRKYGFYSTDEKAISRAEAKAERQKVLDMLKPADNPYRFLPEKAVEMMTRAKFIQELKNDDTH